jgi:hypothetical protein
MLIEEPGANGKKGPIVWEGELGGIYMGGFFQPKATNGLTFQKFMTNHQYDLGVDLYKVKKEYGKALLQGAINSDAPDEVKEAWSNYIANS